MAKILKRGNPKHAKISKKRRERRKREQWRDSDLKDFTEEMRKKAAENTKEKRSQADRLKEYRFKKGEPSPNPKGRPRGNRSRNSLNRLWDALEAKEKELDLDMFDHFFNVLLTNDELLTRVILKLMPTRVEESVSVEDCKALITQLIDVLRKYISDEAMLLQIAAEFEDIELPTKQRRILDTRSLKNGRVK